jgi:hypothetical protein
MARACAHQLDAIAAELAQLNDSEPELDSGATTYPEPGAAATSPDAREG